MKKLLLLSALFFISSVKAETIDLGTYGQLSFTLDPKAWKVTSARAPGNTIEVHISSLTGVNATCGFDVILEPAADSNTKPKLRQVFLEETSDIAKGSVEKTSNPVDLNPKTGYGFYADLTDPDLVGKPSTKGVAKVQTMVMVVVTPKVGLSGAIYSDGFKETPHLQLLSMFKTMEVLAPNPTIKK